MTGTFRIFKGVFWSWGIPSSSGRGVSFDMRPFWSIRRRRRRRREYRRRRWRCGFSERDDRPTHTTPLDLFGLRVVYSPFESAASAVGASMSMKVLEASA